MKMVKVPVYYTIIRRKKVMDREAMQDEFETKMFQAEQELNKK